VLLVRACCVAVRVCYVVRVVLLQCVCCTDFVTGVRYWVGFERLCCWVLRFVKVMPGCGDGCACVCVVIFVFGI
jgi:hypothetical protein